jgi:hypothetical protein
MLEYIREQRLPSEVLDVFDAAGVPFYDGCLIVEVHDHRSSASALPTPRSRLPSSSSLPAHPQPAQEPPPRPAEVYRIVLGPSADTLWSDLTRIPGAETWSVDEAVEFEGKILALTSAPLCLDPSIKVSRIANEMLCQTTLERPSPSRKNKGHAANSQEAEKKQEEREKLMRMGDDSHGRMFAPTYVSTRQSHKLLDARLKTVVLLPAFLGKRLWNLGGNSITIPSMPMQEGRKRLAVPALASRIRVYQRIHRGSAPCPKPKPKEGSRRSLSWEEAGRQFGLDQSTTTTRRLPTMGHHPLIRAGRWGT